MFVVFLGGCLAFAILAIVVCWIANKVHLSMIKDEEKTKRDIEREKENT